MLKRLPLFLVFLLFLLSCNNYSSREVHILPAPHEIEVARGNFILNENTRIQYPVHDQHAVKIAEEMADQFKSLTETEINITEFVPLETANTINIDLDPKLGLAGEEYFLDISQDNITLSASTPAGLFYAYQTFLQLLPLEPSSKISIPCVHIRDVPRFKWRGMHLDVSRHFMDVPTVKKYIDLMAQYKMNVFHWHLTDDQGWRIEIDSYPELTEIGAWRRGPDGKPYGGYYTKEQIREVVAYAAERHVKVIPEIELPGHCQAALAAYPELSCTGGPFDVSTRWGVHEDVFCAGQEATFEFLQAILTEVMALFPSEYIHIGGDEVPKNRWGNCPYCQQRIVDERLMNEFELQSYFVTRIADFLNKHNKKIIGWEEILEGGIPENATLQTWRREKTALTAARMGRDVIMSFYKNYYFNRSAFRTSLHDVYEYEPIPEKLNDDETKHIIGGECALWTEYITQETLDDYMLPRMLAFAEAMWIDKNKKDFVKFYTTLDHHKTQLKERGFAIGPEAEPIVIDARFDPDMKEFYVELSAKHPALEIYYCFHDKLPTKFTNKYVKPLRFSHSGTLCAQAFLGDKTYGKLLQWKHLEHLALGIPALLENPYHKKYTAGGKLGLTNGIKGSDNFLDGCWQGYEGDDLVAVIDLGKIYPIEKIESSYLQKSGSWIFIPKEVTYYISDDSRHFERIATLKPKTSQHTTDVTLETFSCRRNNTRARYIKVHAKNLGICPDWHHGAGGKAWIFADEIVIR